MSSAATPPNSPRTAYEEVKFLFDQAESALKSTEHSPVQLVLPAVNELRYAGRHVVNAIVSGAEAKKETREIEKAKKHCKRALYDVYEARLIYLMEMYYRFKDDYRNVTISTVVHDYVEKHALLNKAFKEFADFDVARRDDRDAYASAVEDICSRVEPALDVLEGAREELNKIIADQDANYRKMEAKERRARRLAFVTTMLMLVAILVAAGAWVFPRPPSSPAPESSVEVQLAGSVEGRPQTSSLQGPDNVLPHFNPTSRI